MRRRALIVLLTVVLVLTAAGVTTVVLAVTRVRGTPEEVARRYLAAWEGNRLTAMRDLVAAPPADFVARHERLAAALRIESIDLTAGKLSRTGEEAAELEFTGVRAVGGLGEWPFRSTLYLAVRDREWKVLWRPATLHPGLAAGGEARLAEIPVPAVTLTTRDRRDFPKNSGAEKYVDDLNRRIAEVVDDPPSGWAVEVSEPGGDVRRLVEFHPPPPEREVRTTLDWFTQAAAARALDGVSRPAAIVAVRPSTGEVLAVADRLGGTQNAFLGLYPPGSTFTVVTAAALLSAGKVTAGASAGCPARYVIPRGRTFTNAGGRDRGTITFRQAFAHSCDTTFARLAVRHLGDGALWTQASRLGFGARLGPGTGATTCTLRRTGESRDLLGADAIGQGTVQASPLCMALVAAAVRDGTWRAPRMMSKSLTRRINGSPRPAMRLPGATVTALRELMSAVVTEGTAASAGLPAGTAGMTGTAAVGGGRTHAWFMGYRGDLAFCALVEGGAGGTGDTGDTGDAEDAEDAAPIVARFLKAL